MKNIHVICGYENNSCGGELMEKEIQYTLKELRARKKETQAQTAKALGVSVQTYNAWEKDISNVAVSKVCAVARHFNVKINQIFLG